MRKALVLTIGTEITCGEIVNTNAAWVSERLEELGVRVFSHLSVRDHLGEIARALDWTSSGDYDVVVVTGGLGPTTDDMTRAAMANFAGTELEFDEAVWQKLQVLHHSRGLGVRDTHRHQCFFPVGSEALLNPVGTALGFYQRVKGRPYFTLPGPPRELQGMWWQGVEPRLRETVRTDSCSWVRWTCLGAPESEIADLTETILKGREIEVGYRAQVPYVKVKIFVEPQDEVVARLDAALNPFVVARGLDDLANVLLRSWPWAEMEVVDEVTGARLISRLLAAKSAAVSGDARAGAGIGVGTSSPTAIVTLPKLRFAESARPPEAGLYVHAEGQELITEVRRADRGGGAGGGAPVVKRRTLPFKTELHSERGRRSATEWVLWDAVEALRAEKLGF